MPHILVSGIVAGRDKRPYVQMDLDGRMAQLSIAQARSVALDLLRAAGYAEADAMIWRFFDKNNFPHGAAGALMQEFRDFRSELEMEKVEKRDIDADTGEERG